MNESDEGHAPGTDEQVDALRAFVASVQHLPLFTATALQLVRTIDQEDTTIDELSRLISGDPALVVHLLRVVNSPFFGLPRRIGTISDACAVMGMDHIRRTVVVAVLQRPLFAYLHDTAIAREFWRHELLCAALARQIAGGQRVDSELAYFAGLLHDVGRLVMLMHFPEQSDLLLDQRSGGDDAGPQAELARFGFTHAQVGAALLELWGLPERIVQAAHQHVDEVEPDDPIAAAVWRGNLISHEFGDEDADVEALPWMASIGLDDAGRREILDEIRALAAES